MTNNVRLWTAKVIKETVGTSISQSEGLALIYLLYNYNLYFSQDIVDDDNEDYPAQFTVRSACEVIADVEVGRITYRGDEYIKWLNFYQDNFHNMNELPETYAALTAEVYQKLIKHPFVKRLEKEL